MGSTVLHLHVVCAENEELARYVLEKRQAILDEGGYKEKLDATLTRAYRNICECKDPILTLRDARGIKGIGQWTLKLLKGFFTTQEEEQEEQEEAQNAWAAGSKAKRRYIPQKSSAPYAILLTLYRALQDGREFMKRQELIDAADASGLSRMQIQPNKVSGPSAQFGYSTKDWYSGWSSMKTLLSKGLVVKSSCPAKYMLTEEGKATAEECLLRSGITTTSSQSPFVEGMRRCSSAVFLAKKHDVDLISVDSVERTKKVDSNVPVFKGTHMQLCIDEAADISSDSEKSGKSNKFSDSDEESQEVEDCTGNLSTSNSNTSSWLHLPPLKQGERFSDAYDVVLLLDDRERFMSGARGSASEKFSDQLRAQFHVEVEVRHLPIGDTLWIARHKLTKEEYVLDFIVERKKVNDLLHSIRDTRYKQQKLRLLRCGLRKLIYIVEGDPNVMDSAESIKTACFTTEIAEGFDVQRTNDIRDTMRKYGHLTHAISGHYDELSVCRNFDHSLCRTYTQFVDQCKDLEKERVTDVFGVMLMQVKQVTENIALSILEKYPTPLSLVLAYSRLAGDERAQEQLLKGIPILYQNKEISASISKKVFEFVCSTGSVTL